FTPSPMSNGNAGTWLSTFHCSESNEQKKGLCMFSTDISPKYFLIEVESSALEAQETEVLTDPGSCIPGNVNIY
ncbi:hypothetical protein ACQP3L_35670, partial [Escherichia coli]